MRIGKVKESILQRSVLRQLHNHSEAGSPAAGEDAGILSVLELFGTGEAAIAAPEAEKAGAGGVPDVPEAELFGKAGAAITASEAEIAGLAGEKIAVAANPVEGWTFAAQRAVYGAMNSLSAAAAKPRAIAVTVLMPEETKESSLKALMKELDALCAEKDLVLLAGHTAVSPFVSTLILSVSALGVLAEAGEEKKISPGLDLVVAGTVGREGAAMIAAEQEEALTNRYAPSYIETARHLFEDGSMESAAELLREAGAVCIHDCREGGVFAGFWELAAAGKVGLSIDLKKIPIRQHTIEVCEYFNLNPYMLRSGGTLLAACENGAHAVQLLQDAGFAAAVAGETTAGNDRIIRYDDEVRFLEPPKTDEYYKTVKNNK